MPAPDQLQKGHTFVDGDTVTGALLNSIVDEGTVLKGAIHEQSLIVGTVPATYEVIVCNSDPADPAGPKRALISQLPAVSSVTLAMPTSEFTVTNSTVSGAYTGTTVWKTQTARKFLAAPVNSTNVPTFRAISSWDMVIAPVAIAANLIDWKLGNVFYKNLAVAGAWVPTMSDADEGQTITVLIYPTHTGASVDWSDINIRWDNGGTPPVQTATVNHSDIYQFWFITGIIFGKRVATDCYI